MKRIFTIISFLLSAHLLMGQDFHFAFDMGNTGSDMGIDIAVDKSINIPGDGSYFVTGTLTGTVDFDPSPNVSTRTSTGLMDVFIAKYDSAGNLIWVTDFGGTLNDAPNSIAVFASDVYVTGLFRGTVDFDPGVGNTSRTASGDADVFLVKFDGNTGTFDWVVTFGGSGTGNTEAGIGVTAYFNAIYLTGVFEGTNINVNPNGTPTYLSATGDMNIFIAKYNYTSGTLYWAKSLGSATLDDDGGKGIVADGNNIYVCGSFAGNCDFNPGVAGGVVTSTGGNDGFIASYTAGGTYRWAHRIGGPLNDEVNDIAMDGNGNIGVTGTVFGNITYTGGSFTTNAGSQDAFIAQLTETGTFNWVHPLGGPGANDEGYTIAMTPCGGLYAGGKFCSTADFNAGAGVANLTGPACGFPNPDYSYFIVSYDENGNYIWANGGSSTGGDSEIRGLDLDICNSLLATGSYSQMQDFDITSGIYNLSPAGGTDAFVSKHFLPKIIISDANRRYFARAVNCANNHKGRDTIAFCIPGNGPHTFIMNNAGFLNSGPLPYITDDYTIIDGGTQQIFAGMGVNSDIIIDGTGLSSPAYGFRFDYADYGEVIDINVIDFPDHGIYGFNSGYLAVSNCYVGGNGLDGIRFFNSANGTVEGSVIGLDLGTGSPYPNGRDGIATNGTSDFTRIGGTDPSETNIISANTRYGIYLRSDDNQVENNGIGVNTGNGDNGIYIEGSDNRIGGVGLNEANQITANDGHGIEIANATNHIQNHFWHNEYWCNTLSAIEINNANTAISPPIITMAAANGIFGTGVPGGYVEIYAPDSSGCAGNNCQGRYFLGSANIDGAGVWTVTGSFNTGQEVVAIQTDGSLNSSNLSTCEAIQGPLSINRISLDAEELNHQTRLLWDYTELSEASSFQIERSHDTRDWEIIALSPAEPGQTRSEMIDRGPGRGYQYYRVGQGLENGDMLYSNTVQIQIEGDPSVRVYPNPARDFFQVRAAGEIYQLSLADHAGRIILERQEIAPEERIDISHLADGVYFVRFRVGGTIFRKALVIHK